METSRTVEIAALLARGIELVGIAVMIVGGVIACALFVVRLFRRVRPASAAGPMSRPASDGDARYRELRANLGRAILLGLEFLVAADIIGTVAIEPSFRSLGVLALIIVIRTFLSFSLELEISGRWPWQHEASARSAAATASTYRPGEQPPAS